MPSTKPPIVVMGVLSSWETFEIKLFLVSSSCSRDPAISLRVVARYPSSFSSVTWSFSEKSPSPKRFAASVISRIGESRRFAAVYITANAADSITAAEIIIAAASEIICPVSVFDTSRCRMM